MNDGLRRRYCLLLFVFLLPGLFACAQIAKKDRELSLDDSLKVYARYLRWGFYDEAAAFVNMREGKKPSVFPSQLQEYRVTRYEVLSSEALDEEGLEIAVMSKVDAYATDSGVIKSTRYKQLWYFVPDEKRWYLDGDLPDLTSR